MIMSVNTKEQLAEMLEYADGAFVSGNEIADKIGITRAAVWKCIHQLENEGYVIEAVRNKGYRLTDASDPVSEACIRRYLKYTPFGAPVLLEVQPTVTSTNDVLKARAQDLPNWYTLIADQQSNGKGRRTRSFYSPPGSGVYLSMLVKLPLPAEEATRITTAAAVAACRAIRACTDALPGIKWVNDVYVNDRKVCGILTEASISMENGGLEWAVLGIGFNVYQPEGGFPKEIAHIAGAITTRKQKNLRAKIAAAFITHFQDLCLHLLEPVIVKEYKEQSIMKGRQIDVLRGSNAIPAVAEEIDDMCRLVVRYKDGTTEALSSGEVSIRL